MGDTGEHSEANAGELRHLLRLGVPIALSYLANSTMQIVDMIFVGRLGADAIGGISIGNALFAAIMVGGIGLSLGLDFLMSRAYGAKDLDETHRLLVQALYLATVFSLPGILLMQGAPLICQWIGIAPDAAAQGAIYLKILSWSLWPWLLFSAFRQYLQATDTAAPVLYIMIVANLVNVAGNSVFIFGRLGFPALGIAGAAYSTLMSRFFMLTCIVCYAFMRNSRLGLGLEKTSLKASWRRISDILRLGIPAAGQVLLEVGVFATSTLLVGRLGAAPLAAFQIVLQIASTTFMIPLGLASGTAVRVAQSIGAGSRGGAGRIGWLGIRSSAGFMLGCGVILYVCGEPILRAFTNDESVLSIARGLLLLAALFQIFDGVQVAGTGALRGIGNTRTSFIANFFGHWLLGLPLGLFLCFRLQWGAFGLWTGLSIGLIFVAIVLAVAWRLATASLEAAIGDQLPISVTTE